MAAVSAWSKPGAWALESEEHDAATAATAAATLDKVYSSTDSHQSSDFPSLSAAATAKIPKKKKKQVLSLAEFTTGSAVTPGAGGKFQPSSKSLALTSNELLSLPTGPRERSEEELQRPRGFGYGGGRDRGPSRDSDERGPRSEPRDLGPSRADEVDDWGAMKKSVGGFERRDRDKGFFDSQSRADESDSWISKKGSAMPPPVSDGRRERRGYDLFNKEGSNESGMDSDSWGKKREESGGIGRPRLMLQRRTLPIVNTANVIDGDEKKMEEEEKKPVEPKSKGVNPFGHARPREEVLKEKGKDWKVIDEKLDAVRIQDIAPPVGRKGFGTGNGLKEDRTERAWRKPVTEAEANDTTSSPRAESVEEQSHEN